MNVGELVSVLICAFFAVLLIWEPVQIFWTKHTWREEHGLYVRDYAPLREWAFDSVRLLLFVAVWVGIIWFLYPIL